MTPVGVSAPPEKIILDVGMVTTDLSESNFERKMENKSSWRLMIYIPPVLNMA